MPPLLLVLAVVAAAPDVAEPRPDSMEARRLWLAALERRSEMDGDSAARLLRLSIDAHSGFVPAHYHVATGDVYVSPAERAAVRRELDGKDDPTHACLRTVYDAPRGYPAAAVDPLLALERRAGPTACSATFLSYFTLISGLTPARVWLPVALEHARLATELNPEMAGVWVWYVDALERMSRPEEGIAVLERALNAVPAAELPTIYQRLTMILASSGHSDRARALALALEVAIDREARPGLRWVRPMTGPGARPGPADEEAALRTRLRLAQASGDVARVRHARTSLGWILANSGAVIAALEQFDALVTLADSLDDAVFRAGALIPRGRALSKLGRFDAAERDLEEAVSLARRLGEPHQLAEAYHNLAHVHEGTGRMQEAVRAIDRFVEASRSLASSQPRVMSHRDAGLLRRRLGWHAAANASFDRMARAVAEHEQNFYWAGEHYERTGRLEDALAQYRRGAAHDPFERSLNLAGLTRVYRALGRGDSAEAAARRHDEAPPDQLTVPLLPGILAEQGRTAEALTAAGEWVRRREREGNVQSLARARLELADLLLAADRPDSALVEARAARTAARRANFEVERVRALEIEGTALVHLGRQDEGLTHLRSAVEASGAGPHPEDVRRTQLALGHALVRMGRPDEALDAYDAAARAVERVSGALGEDLNRTRYRGRHLEPFDAAIHVLLRKPPTEGSLDAMLRWSQRRKAAALRAGGLNGHAAADVGLAAIRAHLGAAALLDYIVSDSVAVSLVVTAGHAAAVPLRATPDSLEALVRRLRRPFAQYAGMIDLGRAVYDLEAAHALYRAVLAPVEAHLDGVGRLLISPDAALHRVPFDALVTRMPGVEGDHGDAGFALDRYTTSLVPSARLAPGPDPKRQVVVDGDRVLAVTRDAPGGDPEVAAARAAWGAARTTVLTGEAATETALRRLSRSAAVLHIATHAEADDRDPLASHLRLGPDSIHDGYLHLAEVAELESPARLVLLTGCETFDGPFYRGAGLMGLARAFLTGGAHAVIATHWAVPAAATPLVAAVHRRLAAGADPATALTEAKRELVRRPASASPFLWAPFVLVQRGLE